MSCLYCHAECGERSFCDDSCYSQYEHDWDTLQMQELASEPNSNLRQRIIDALESYNCLLTCDSNNSDCGSHIKENEKKQEEVWEILRQTWTTT